jgi:hypothetical protein
MNTEKGGCLIVCSWQPGATLETFNEEAFQNEVCVPLLDIFVTPGSPVDKVLIVTRYGKAQKGNKDVEVSDEVFLREEGTPAHILTPTSAAVLANLNSWVGKGRVLYLNVDTKNEDEAINQAVVFARNQGDCSVIIPHGVAIPDDLAKLTILFQKAQDTGLALRYTLEYPRTVELVT